MTEASPPPALGVDTRPPCGVNLPRLVHLSELLPPGTIDPGAGGLTCPPRQVARTEAPMSEELHQRGLTEHGVPVGSYEYYNIGATTIGALKKFKVVPNRDYGRAAANKPDGVLVDRRDKRSISVILVAEHKTTQEFDTP